MTILSVTSSKGLTASVWYNVLYKSFFFFYSGKPTPYLTIPVTDSKVTAAVWGPLDQYLLTGHENGSVSKWCAKVDNSYKRIPK